MLVTLGGVRQLLVVTATRVVGLTPDKGTLLWEYPWSTFNGINVAQPIVFTHNGRDRIFMSASYGHGAAVFELARAGDRFQAKTIWENERMKNKFTSSVLHKGTFTGSTNQFSRASMPRPASRTGRAAAMDTDSSCLPATISSCSLKTAMSCW